MPVVDTSSLVALLDADHVHHDRARAQLTGHARVLVPTVVLAELSTFLRRTAQDAGLDGNKVARDAVRGLLQVPGVHHEATHDHALAMRLWAGHRALSLADAVVIATATRHGEALLCLDARMDKVWKKQARGR